ncbi:MAG: phosphoribosylamine--glycine ligase [Gemmatimonadota bacterium]|nr:phosphoribosylamine--glycine ligase [Gemmatimonadota bacterium]
MKVLIVGGGAREHAIAWKLLQDEPTLDIIAAPGNPGIATIARCVAVPASDVPSLLALARTEHPDLTVVGPEGPLAAGIVDEFQAAAIPIFGPTRAAAQIETSKVFAKEIMARAGVPTARASHHTTMDDALRAVHEFGAPVVIKASGLAAGKGVVVAATLPQAERAVRDMLLGGAFGGAGSELLVEEYMEGEEISVFALCGRNSQRLMLGAQDHKRLEDGDRGPNTGGMGAYAPLSLDTPDLQEEIRRRIFAPTLAALSDAGAPFAGLLYAGLMLTRDGPRVVEFNCRFGDPETETLLPLMSSSLLEPLLAIARGESLEHTPELTWRSGASVTTVLAASGYPGAIRTGNTITFPPPVEDVYVFHAGTRLADGAQSAALNVTRVATDGGRVLAVTAVAPSLPRAAAMSRGYAERVAFDGKQMRRDIGWRELERVSTQTNA